jgi:hypothetical protein
MVNQKRVENAIKREVFQRNYRRARDRALVKLAKKYSEEYRVFLEEEKQADEAQGKKWIDLDGNTDFIVGIHTSIEHSNAQGGDSSLVYGEEGDNK